MDSPVSPVRTFLPFPASPVYALVAPMNMLSLNLSRCPRKRSQGPAGDMWSVVVLPLVLISTGISRKSLPSQAGQGSINCSLSLRGSTCSLTPLPSLGGAIYVACPRSKFLAGTSGATLGGSSRNDLPSAPVREAGGGVKETFPARAEAG